ncbi:MAG: phosphoribosylformylglycinamidine synthase subunit PurL [Methyloceanibacter sp.]|uniref:phosphoribosylformylglycinamidine synthase subunit PurL n=1 Tax=Methyloceanibacter sp. TaxID=1965321 RepID=UPI003C36D9F5
MADVAPEATGLSEELIAEHGISPEEYERLLKELGREPSLTELGVFSVMWSEHCSYKSSRIWLKKLPTTGPQVILGPGENAGVVSLGDGQAAVFKMESHNHPSYIEPYQGAATGVGGIMRDVFTMGARPIANMNALRFGSPGHPKTRHLVAGVVSGIGDYGNCMGVPTIGGETNFDPGYNDNIVVNAMCVGLVDANRIFKSAAKGVGLPVVYVGSKTGRDGIHGATMASAEFDEDSEEKRPTVQVGDPFTEKLLLEACLELMTKDVIIAIQDMGAAGLTSSSVEMADKGSVGIDLDLDKVPMREEGMTAYEMLLSESQERMLMVLKPGSEPVAERIFTKWELDFAVIGETTDTGHFVARHNGEVEADIPLPALAHAAPIYERPYEKREALPTIAPDDVQAPPSILSALERLLGSPHLSSRRWIYEQYDHMVMADTVQRPGGDAGVVRVHGTDKGLAVSCDVTPRYCTADPFEGGKQAVAECWRNLTATGAKPLAITDCLNFGNPERPEIMGEFVGAIEGMAEACTVLHFPVVSGNVSLYNETNGVAIPPTPAVGGVGLIANIDEMADMALKADGDVILLLGRETGHLGQSIYMAVMEDRLVGAPPPVDLAGERVVGDLVRGLIKASTVNAAHDVSDGGLLVAIAEMALAGKRGVALEAAPEKIPAHAIWFGEDQARYVVAAKPDKVDTIVDVAAVYDVPVRVLGTVGGDTVTLFSEAPLPLDMLRAAYEDWLPRFMTRR